MSLYINLSFQKWKTCYNFRKFNQD